ncbi:MAG: polymerase, sigma-24 subunit, subfamily [Bryobacterales bacterium]|nr:polymerase, sigma-24 subunit, subfamily [Bryobacterales bacterium]
MAHSDQELYDRMRKGDQQAFAELYERHEPALFRYALHLSGNHFVAEEVAHEVFLHLAGSYIRFDAKRGSLEAYLYGTIRNLVRVVWRKRACEPRQDQIAACDVLGDLIHDERTAALYAALRELPDHYRDAIMLCELEEKSYEDAARLLNCPVGTIRSRVHRARILLAARLRPLMMPAGMTAR